MGGGQIARMGGGQIARVGGLSGWWRDERQMGLVGGGIQIARRRKTDGSSRRRHTDSSIEWVVESCSGKKK